MNWTETLKTQVEDAYRATEGLVKRVKPEQMNWKPPTGENWMTTGQLLMHITTACGFCCKGFVTGDWGMPEGGEAEAMTPAEKMPTIESAEKALEALAADKTLALEMIDEAGEEDLANRTVGAPWAPDFQQPLGRYLLMMIGHLQQHKDQLFFYLKLQGEPVNTMILYGME